MRAPILIAAVCLLLAFTAGPAVAQTDTATATPTATANGTATPAPGGDVGADEPLGLFELLDSTTVFIALVIGVFALIGMWSRSLTFGAWSGSVAFYAIAFRVGIQIYQQIALLTLVLVFLGMAFKLIAFEFEVEN